MLFFENPEYTFYNVLEDACLFFEVSPQDHVLKDDGNLWPLSCSVDDFMINLKVDLNLYLVNKAGSKKKAINDDNESRDDIEDTIDVKL